MTNEEKAREILKCNKCGFKNKTECNECFDKKAILEMAEWKDKQHSVAYVVTRCEEHDDYVEEVFFDIKKAEQYCAKYNNNYNEDEYCRYTTKVNVTL